MNAEGASAGGERGPFGTVEDEAALMNAFTLLCEKLNGDYWAFVVGQVPRPGASPEDEGAAAFLQGARSNHPVVGKVLNRLTELCTEISPGELRKCDPQGGDPPVGH